MRAEVKALVGLSLAAVMVLGAVVGYAFIPAVAAGGNHAGNDAGNQPGDGVGNQPGDGVGNQPDEPDEPDEPNEPDAPDDREATVTFDRQSLDCEENTVVMQEVTLSDGGFVVIHGPDGDVVGVSGYLEAGTHEDVTVELDVELSADATLTAMAHRDTNDNGQFDFVTSEGDEDAPYLRDGAPVTDDGCIVVDCPVC